MTLESAGAPQPLVSIITPAYNAESVIAETIESVCRQDYVNWEMLISDDGSTDRTAEIVRDFAANDSRIRLLRVEGETGHAARARNNSLAQARGEIIAFLDADDVWVPEKLSRQLDYLAAHASVDAVSSYYSVFGNGEAVERETRMLWRFKSREVSLHQALVQTLLTSSVVMRRRCYEELGGMDEHPSLVSGQDFEYFARLCQRYTVHQLPEELVRYRVVMTGASLSRSRHATSQRLARGMAIHDALARKGVLDGKRSRVFRSLIHYNVGKDNLFHHHIGFRRYLLRSLAIGGLQAPAKAWVMFGLSILPGPVLRRVLVALLRLRNPK